MSGEAARRRLPDPGTQAYAVLAALLDGNHTTPALRDATGLSLAHVSVYIGTLRHSGLVRASGVLRRLSGGRPLAVYEACVTAQALGYQPGSLQPKAPTPSRRCRLCERRWAQAEGLCRRCEQQQDRQRLEREARDLSPAPRQVIRTFAPPVLRTIAFSVLYGAQR